jgi:hypothetical protein
MSDVTKIIVNGREYGAVEQMPPEVREEYLQAVAAMREAGVAGNPGIVKKDVLSRSVVQESFIYNGREYKSRDDLPPEVRALLEQMPEPAPDVKTTEVEIKTTQTFPSEVRRFGGLADEREEPPEKVPAIAWLLVKILVVVVVILLFLLFLFSLKSKV